MITSIARSAAAARGRLVAGCGTPGGDSGDNTKKADEAKKNSAKVDVAKAGDVTLTIWDQEVRGGQSRADQAPQRRRSRRSTRT